MQFLLNRLKRVTCLTGVAVFNLASYWFKDNQWHRFLSFREAENPPRVSLHTVSDVHLCLSGTRLTQLYRGVIIWLRCFGFCRPVTCFFTRFKLNGRFSQQCIRLPTVLTRRAVFILIWSRVQPLSDLFNTSDCV